MFTEHVRCSACLVFLFISICIHFHLSYGQHTLIDKQFTGRNYENEKSQIDEYAVVRSGLKGRYQCLDNEGRNGRCVPKKNCLWKSLKRSDNNDKNSCVTEDKTIGVCCNDKFLIKDKYSKEKKEEHAMSRNKKILRIKRAEKNKEVPPTNIKEMENICGQNSFDGKKAGAPWPWLVSLKITNSKDHFCGATLISRFHLVSAAHCFVLKEGIAKKESIVARIGDYDFRYNNITNFTDFKIADLLYHEAYNLTTNEHDIAILVLEKPVIFSEYVQPICLPQVEQQYEGKTATVAGWGHVKTGGPGSDILREFEIPVWKLAECRKSIDQTIFNTNLCAGDKDGSKDLCQNDSGGPLMLKIKNGTQERWELVGVVSWGIKCDTNGKPGVYTQVNKYVEWINLQIIFINIKLNLESAINILNIKQH